MKIFPLVYDCGIPQTASLKKDKIPSPKEYLGYESKPSDAEAPYVEH